MTLSSNKRQQAPAPHPHERSREVVWLENAAAEAGAPEFAAHALRRLAEGEELYGDRRVKHDLAGLVDELAEGAADLGSWGVLALEALDADAGLADPQRELVAATLHAAVLWGALAHHALGIARDHLGTRAEEAA